MDTLVESKATLKTPAYAAKAAKAQLAPLEVFARPRRCWTFVRGIMLPPMSN